MMPSRQSRRPDDRSPRNRRRLRAFAIGVIAVIIMTVLLALGQLGLHQVGPAAPAAGQRAAAASATRAPRDSSVRPAHWTVRSVDTMKLSRDTRKKQLSTAQIVALIRLDALLHVTHIAVDAYYDDPGYLARWAGVVRSFGLHVWFRAHWYAWENHRDASGTMSPHAYIAATRLFLQAHADLLRDGDIFDFCSEPENSPYWLRTYGPGWSWRNHTAKRAFNTFVRAGVGMAGSTLSNRGLGGVTVTDVSVNPSVALRLLSKPTVCRLGRVTLDVYPDGGTRDPVVAARRLLAQIARVHERWPVSIVLGEFGYARDFAVDDATQGRVLGAELHALATLPYVRGMNYWVDAGGPGYGGYTNLYRRAGGRDWVPRPAAAVVAAAYARAR